jgi:hypothetical protein
LGKKVVTSVNRAHACAAQKNHRACANHLHARLVAYPFFERLPNIIYDQPS